MRTTLVYFEVCGYVLFVQGTLNPSDFTHDYLAWDYFAVGMTALFSLFEKSHSIYQVHNLIVFVRTVSTWQLKNIGTAHYINRTNYQAGIHRKTRWFDGVMLKLVCTRPFPKNCFSASLILLLFLVVVSIGVLYYYRSTAVVYCCRPMLLRTTACC